MIRIDEHFEQSQQEVWAALTDPERLSDWLGGPSSIEPTVGGAVRLTMADDGVEAHGVVRACDPPRPGFAVAHLEHTFVDDARPDQPSVCVWSVVRDEHRPDTGCDLHLVMDDPAAGPTIADRLTAPPATPIDDALTALREAQSVLLVDWIGPELPSLISRRVPEVYGKIGPKDDDWARIEPTADDEQGFRAIRGPCPDHVNLLHLDWTLGFDEFADEAVRLGASTFWYHSARTRPPAPADHRGCWVPRRQSAAQRARIEASGLSYIDDHYLADVAERL